MGRSDYMDEAGRQRREEEEQLIPGLPDEIGMECLVRVPFGSHSRMKSVCRGWCALFSHPSFFEQRRKARSAEHLVCLVQPLLPTLPPPSSSSSSSSIIQFHADDVVLKERDGKRPKKQQEEDDFGQYHHHPSESTSAPLPLYQYGLSIFNATHQTWHQVKPGPASIPMFCHCIALPSSGKLLLLGGWDPTTLNPVPDVYVLHLIGEDAGRWRRTAPMSVARSFFACAVVGRSTLYVAGGHDSQKNALRSAEVYDAEADEWRTIPPMSEERDESQGLSWKGDSRFWVVSGYSTENQGQFRSDAECYDPETGCWSKVEGLWPFPSGSSPRGCCVSASATTANSSRGRGQSSNHQLWRIAFPGVEEQQGGGIGLGGEIREYEREALPLAERWRVVSSIPLPHPEFGLGGSSSSSKCVLNLHDGGGNGDGKSSRRMLVMGSGGEGKVGAFILERNDNEKTKWNQVHVPPQFNGFPYSAAHLLL